MKKYFDTVVTQSGDIIVGASIQVNYSGGGAAAVYSDNGVTPANNPLTTNANGYYDFYVADGRYDLVISASGFAGYTITDILISEGSLPVNDGLLVHLAGSEIISGQKTFESVPQGNILPAGVMMAYGGPSAPAGWLICDGLSYVRASYPNLFSAIGTVYGAADGTHFNVPDLRGRVPIGSDAGALAATIAEASWTNSGGSLSAAVTSNVDTWITGMLIRATTTNTLPTGLSLATDYYVIRASSTSLKFATSLANAVAGTAIPWTNDGTGNHTITHTLSTRALGQKLGEETHASTVAEMAVHNHTATDSGHTHSYSFDNVPGGGSLASGSDSGTANTGSGSANITVANTGSSNAHNNMPPGLVINYIIKY